MSIHRPTYMEGGAARVISPDGTDQVPADLWAEFAAITLLEPEPALLKEWVANLEDHLGVHEAHRIALEQGQDAALAYIREQKRRRLLDRSQASASQRPRDPAMVAAIDDKLAQLAEAVAAVPSDAPTKKDRRAKKSAEAKVRKLTEELDQLRADELAQDQLYGAAAEPIYLARQRGEEVVAFEAETADFARDEHGAIIRHKRGTKRGMPILAYDRGLRARKLAGIYHALASGHLDGGRGAAHPEQLKATGEQYGGAYEALDPLKAANTEGGGGGYGPKGPQIKAVEAGETLKIMRQGMSPRELGVLDRVCGQHMTVRQAADDMSAGFPATERALRSGLRMAGENWRVAQERRRYLGQPSAAESIRVAHRLISRMRT